MLNFESSPLETEKQSRTTQIRHGDTLFELIEQAASSLAVDKSVFLRAAIAKEAQRVLEAQSRHVLTPEDAALLDPNLHERAGFSCGVARLDNYLKRNAKKQQKDDMTRVYVIVENGHKTILGYHAINLGMMNVDELSKRPRGELLNTAKYPFCSLDMLRLVNQHKDKVWALF